MKLIARIGQGGFGVVDKVQDENGNYWARKTFSINQPTTPTPELALNIKKRFIQEAIRQEAISHRNIIPIVSKDLDAEPPYFNMPVAISTLESDLMSDHTLGGNFMNVILDILAGLEELHTMRYYHRDLKPANVLRFRDVSTGEEFYAIGDFGLMAVRQTQVSTLTQTGMRMSADYYTAPEVVSDLKRATAQSDIFSVGCILHDCLVGVGQQRVPCAEIKSNSIFGNILKKCTVSDPSRRFRSITALRDALSSLGEMPTEVQLDKTNKANKFLNDLKEKPEGISVAEWEEIITFLENEPEQHVQHVLLMAIQIPAINDLIDKDFYLANRFGAVYANWVRVTGFKFEDCDAISNRLEQFIKRCDMEIQCECLLAMMYLGTSHNRWYVEEKFVKYVSIHMDLTLARRFAIECRVEEEDFCSAIRRLKSSINYSIENLHPLIYDIYRQVCRCR